ncbi:hypothetical protein [Fusobacterium hominis]|uniref:Uncharacterized protein n=1 Tax=Fusobacterium hominis TaxID=2764326 RepID=A0A7G9GXJ4_9FUSO|nr:hypothetical protein [Fusobacterium hominis]QNM15526.1 hypothetical protein H9Q81_01410 [Fusobacterium hominis]
MAEFNGNVITNDGRNLLSRALAGQGKIIFTKAAFGAGRQDIPAREVRDLKDKKLDLVIMNRRNDSGTAILTVHITNKDVEESFRTQEFGVYAKLEGDKEEVLYCYSLAIEPDFFPNNKLGITYESVVDLYMTLSTEVESGIYIKEGTVFITKDIADQVYSTTGVAAVGKLEGRERLEADKSYLAADGSWYFNIGGVREWNKSGVKDTKLIPMTWKYLYEWIINKFSTLKLNWKDITDKPNLTSTEDLNKLLNKKEDTINKKTAFNKDFGIAAGTVLEGDKYPLIEQKFKGVAGDEINPSFIQSSGEKKQGKFYLDKNTGRLYRCIKSTTSTSNSSENFEDVSLANISDRLNNLITFSGSPSYYCKIIKSNNFVNVIYRNLTLLSAYEKNYIFLPYKSKNDVYYTKLEILNGEKQTRIIEKTANQITIYRTRANEVEVVNLEIFYETF